MAGLDGIRNKIDPGDPVDKNIYDLPPEELAEIPHGAGLARGGARGARGRPRVPARGRRVHRRTSSRTTSTYKREKEVDPIRLRPHPYEFVLYYDI